MRASATAKSSLEYRASLVALLGKENKFVVEDNSNALGEDYSEYYAEVLQEVTSFKSPASLNALVGAIATGPLRQQISQPGL